MTELEVIVTRIANGGRTVFTLPHQKKEYDATGTHYKGLKSVTIYRDGTVAVSGRFTNRELEAVIGTVAAVSGGDE